MKALVEFRDVADRMETKSVSNERDPARLASAFRALKLGMSAERAERAFKVTLTMAEKRQYAHEYSDVRQWA